MSNEGEAGYLALLEELYADGERRTDRTGVGTFSLFGRQLRFNLRDGFPILTTKHVNFKGVVGELLWMLSGSTNVNDLHEYGVRFWDEWADEDGQLGPIYGHQWRSWGFDLKHWNRGIDQIAEVIRLIEKDPTSRRMVVSAWNVYDLEEMALPPCHALFQFYVSKGRLACHLYQRSADIFLGVPFNIASYALLTHMIAAVTDLDVGELIISYGDVHLYQNHLEQALTQLGRKPRRPPYLHLRRAPTIDDFKPSDFELVGYAPDPAIPAPIAV